MKIQRHNIIFFILIALLFPSIGCAQEVRSRNKQKKEEGYIVPYCIYQGDTIPSITLQTVYIYKPLTFKNKRQYNSYRKLIRDVKKVYPISKEIHNIILETYEFLMTLPDEESRQKHIKMVEKGIKEQYTPRMKKLTFSQGKLLIKLVDRQNNQTSFELVRAFMGPFKAGFYQTFAALFGASLKKEYDPEGKDQMVERIITLIESGQL